MKNIVNGTLGTVLFTQKRFETENTSFKNSVNSTKLTMLFSWKREKSENTSVKNSGNGTKGTMLFQFPLFWENSIVPSVILMLILTERFSVPIFLAKIALGPVNR